MKERKLIVVKRDGKVVPFDSSKIKNAILKAMPYGNGVSHEIARLIAKGAENYFEGREEITISEIESYVFDRFQRL